MYLGSFTEQVTIGGPNTSASNLSRFAWIHFQAFSVCRDVCLSFNFLLAGLGISRSNSCCCQL